MCVNSSSALVHVSRELDYLYSGANESNWLLNKHGNTYVRIEALIVIVYLLDVGSCVCL